MDEYIEYNKIYARADESGKVTDIFSEAFKTPDENDICIDATNTDRHGAQRYQVYDEHGIANYVIVNGALVERDKIEINNIGEEIDKRNVKISNLKMLLNKNDYKRGKYIDGFLTKEEYEPTRLQMQEWRVEINLLEEEIAILQERLNTILSLDV